MVSGQEMLISVPQLTMVISYVLTIHMHISTYLVATIWLTYLHLVTIYVPLLTDKKNFLRIFVCSQSSNHPWEGVKKVVIIFNLKKIQANLAINRKYKTLIILLYLQLLTQNHIYKFDDFYKIFPHLLWLLKTQNQQNFPSPIMAVENLELELKVIDYVHETHKRKVINTIHSLLPAEELPSVT